MFLNYLLLFLLLLYFFLTTIVTDDFPTLFKKKGRYDIDIFDVIHQHTWSFGWPQFGQQICFLFFKYFFIFPWIITFTSSYRLKLTLVDFPYFIYLFIRYKLRCLFISSSLIFTAFWKPSASSSSSALLRALAFWAASMFFPFSRMCLWISQFS